MRFELDIAHIRDELNELPFRDGKRRILLGKVSEMFEHQSEQAIVDQLQQWEQELRSHTLILTRHEADPDSLVVVQELRAHARDLSWLAEGMRWASKISTVALEMVLPGLAGLWLDHQFKTRFLALLGFTLGVPLGIRHLLVMTKPQREIE